ncbi:MAG: hypothetical protein D6730_15650 [Bacteroidetes bacterium]|nr:MAG: hypothetical protein D6730_15650 [Bacteroidota bacterium]
MMYLLLIPLFLVGFIALWVGIIFLISYVGGWRQLARDFPFREQQAGTLLSSYSFCSLQLSWLGSYNNCMTLGIHQNGIRLQPLAFFQLFHPPVFIRWQDMQQARPGTLVFYKTWKFRAGGHELRLFGRAAKEVATYYEQNH